MVLVQLVAELGLVAELEQVEVLVGLVVVLE